MCSVVSSNNLKFKQITILTTIFFFYLDYCWYVQALFLLLYKNFTSVLMERLPEASRVGTLQELKSSSADAMAVDLEEPSTMEVDNENERPKKRFFNLVTREKNNNNPFAITHNYVKLKSMFFLAVN